MPPSALKLTYNHIIAFPGYAGLKTKSDA